MADVSKDEDETIFNIYELTEVNGKRHSALSIPRKLSSDLLSDGVVNSSDVFNIFMGDVSGSMCSYWPLVSEGWQTFIKDKLTGRTSVYVFGTQVTHRRFGTDVLVEDNLGGGTNLTTAFRIVREDVEKCSESNVRIFIVTDGAHGCGHPLPETEIEKMSPPPGKTVSVYLLGIGLGFPVNISVDMRSRMHNGNSNIPVLFWAKCQDEIVDQMMALGAELDSGLIKLTMNLEGHILPGLPKTSMGHAGEWLYFDEPSENLPSLEISVNDGPLQPVSTVVKPVAARLLLDRLFRQWNSVLIQQHRKKAHVPRETYALMDSLFGYHLNIIMSNAPTGQDVKSRLIKKQQKTIDLEYRTLVNQSKSIIDVEGAFQNELELAETILKTTVTNRKYDTKLLKLKGHHQEDYEGDLTKFKQLYDAAKPNIMALAAPTPDDCCRVTITSTLSDLQDPNFHMLLEESKFEMLKSFTMTGIPIFSPVRDASQINPWTIVIKHILVTPFTILSQQVLEHGASASETNMSTENKDVILQQDNEKTRFNAIVPIVSENACKVLKPLVLSNFYAMMSTFCILKNPHIIDYSAHIAALGCVWVRTVREFPIDKRPEFAAERLKNIVATANLYMGRPAIRKYVDALVKSPKQALMTESVDEFDGKTLKCEALIKPAFFMYLKKDMFSEQQMVTIFELMLYEYLGRCLASYKVDESEASPFTDFFCKQLSDKDSKKTWLAGHCKVILDGYQEEQGNLLEKFFTLDDLIPEIKKAVAQKVDKLTKTLSEEISLALDMDKVKHLSNFGSCGDIKWSSFRVVAQEIGISKEKIDELFSPSRVMTYVSQALLVKNSRERMSNDLPSPDTILESVMKKVLQENTRNLRSSISKEIEDYAVNKWKEDYKKAHSALMMPLTQQQVVQEAQAKDIDVTVETFKKVYRYNEIVGVVRNACQIPECPHYLVPHNNFNQHLSIEREEKGFPHSLHLVSKRFCSHGKDKVVNELLTGIHAGRQKRRFPTPPRIDFISPLNNQLESLIVKYTGGYGK